MITTIASALLMFLFYIAAVLTGDPVFTVCMMVTLGVAIIRPIVTNWS